jgi:hypothetical protein
MRPKEQGQTTQSQKQTLLSKTEHSGKKQQVEKTRQKVNETSGKAMLAQNLKKPKKFAENQKDLPARNEC